MSALLAAAPNDPVATPPARRPGSVRRTSTMLMFWPGGLGTDLHLVGRARDLLTPLTGEPKVLAAADLSVVTGPGRDIQQIEAHPVLDGLESLLGCRAGGNLRKSIAEVLPQDVDAGNPLHLLLDDLAGASLISGFAFYVWAHLIPGFHERMATSPPVMIGICSGFQEGSQRAESRRHAEGRQHEPRSSRPPRRPGRPAGLARARRAPRDRHAQSPPDRRLGRGRRDPHGHHVPRQLLEPRR